MILYSLTWYSALNIDYTSMILKERKKSIWKGRGREVPEASALKTAKRDNQACEDAEEGRGARPGVVGGPLNHLKGSCQDQMSSYL